MKSGSHTAAPDEPPTGQNRHQGHSQGNPGLFSQESQHGRGKVAILVTAISAVSCGQQSRYTNKQTQTNLMMKTLRRNCNYRQRRESSRETGIVTGVEEKKKKKRERERERNGELKVVGEAKAERLSAGRIIGTSTVLVKVLLLLERN